MFSALNFEGMFEVGATITFLGKTRIFTIFLTFVLFLTNSKAYFHFKSVDQNSVSHFGFFLIAYNKQRLGKKKMNVIITNLMRLLFL